MRRNAPRTLDDTELDYFGAKTETNVWDYGSNGRGRLVQWIARGVNTQPQLQWISHDPQGRVLMDWRSFNTAGYNVVRAVAQTFFLGGRPQRTAYGDASNTDSVQTVSDLTYDARGLPSTISTDLGFTFQPPIVETRNVAGLVTKRRVDYPSGSPMTYTESNWTYDVLGRVTNQTFRKGNDDSARPLENHRWCTTVRSAAYHALLISQRFLARCEQPAFEASFLSNSKEGHGRQSSRRSPR